jgi:hypothetical protein
MLTLPGWPRGYPAAGTAPAFLLMRHARNTLVLAVAVLSWPSTAFAQSDTATLNASVASLVRLSVSSSSLTFPDSDPDTIPLVPASPAVISITAKSRTPPGGEVTLTVEATDDLRSGVTTIPASSITWTATGPGFVSGTLGRTPQTVASWTGSGVRTGTQTFLFQNLWTYSIGTYTVTMIFTLSAA